MDIKYRLKKPEETIYEHVVRIAVIALMGIFMLIAILGNVAILGDAGIAARSVGSSILAVIVTAVFLAIFSIFSQKATNKYKAWLVVIFVISLALRVIMLSAWNIAPANDFADTYDAARGIATAYNSDVVSLIKSKYSMFYTTWSVHMPFILFETVILKLFGEGTYLLQIIFNIFGALSCVMTALIAGNMYGKRSGIIAGLIMAMLPLNLMYSSVLTNQHMATFFFLCAVYFIVVSPLKKRMLNIASAAVFAALSQLMRPEMIVFVIAVICYFIYRYILSSTSKRRAKRHWRKFTSRMVMIVTVYTMIVFAANIMLMQSGIIKRNITETNLSYKIATGLNMESQGRWNEADYELVNDGQKLDELVEQRTKDFGQVMGLGVNKIAYQYGTYNYPWCIDGKNNSFIDGWYGALTNDVMLVILLLCLLRVILSTFMKTRREIFLMILMVGYFFTFMVIEVQNRYNYFAIPIFVVMASGSVVYLHSKVKKAFKNIAKDKQIAETEKVGE